MADTKDIKRILIINLAFIGDVLLSTPVARALRQAFPAARIDMMVIPLTASVARGNPYLDDVIEYDKRGKHKKIGEIFNLVRQIRARRYDLAVATNFAPRGAMLAWASGIPLRVGYEAQHAGWFLTHMASPRRPAARHEADNYLDVLKPLGITADDTSLAFQVNPAEAESLKAKTHLTPGKPLVLICPVGSYRQKSWTTAAYAALIRSIAPRADCYLIGAKGEAGQLEEINAAAGHLAGVLAGTLTLGELAALIAAAKLLVTVDTGPMHIASAVGTPVIALFGPTDPCKWGPRGAHDKVFYAGTSCSPCWGRIDCPEVNCMADIDSEAVIAAAVSVIERRGAKESEDVFNSTDPG